MVDPRHRAHICPDSHDMADVAARRERFDLCQVEYTETGYFWNPPPDLPAALTCNDIIAKPAFRRYEGSSGLRPGGDFRRLEDEPCVLRGRAVSRYRTVFTLSEEDREWANRLYPEARVRVLLYPGGIDHVGLPRQEVPGRVLFVGALQRPLNIQYLRFLAEKVLARMFDGKFPMRNSVWREGAPCKRRGTAVRYSRDPSDRVCRES